MCLFVFTDHFFFLKYFNIFRDKAKKLFKSIVFFINLKNFLLINILFKQNSDNIVLLNSIATFYFILLFKIWLYKHFSENLNRPILN